MRWLVAVLLVSCARPSCPPPKVFASPPRPFLWTVTGGHGPVTLYGTYHAAGDDDVPPAARAALAAAPVFVSEVGDIDSDVVRAQATLPRGQSLATLLGPDAWYELADALAGVISDENLRHVRPWYAMSLLTSSAADLPDVVMDDALKKAATAKGKRLETLEETAEQLGLLGDSVGVDDLRQALADRKEVRCDVAAQRVAYRAGDDAAFTDPLGSQAATQTLLVERNRRWMTKIETYLQGDGAFIAVGVGHLVGPGNLVDLLAARGYRVERAR